MTFEEKLMALLVEHGMFESQAQVIIDRVKRNKDCEAVNMHWGHQIDGYPAQMLAVV